MLQLFSLEAKIPGRLTAGAVAAGLQVSFAATGELVGDGGRLKSLDAFFYLEDKKETTGGGNGAQALDNSDTGDNGNFEHDAATGDISNSAVQASENGAGPMS